MDENLGAIIEESEYDTDAKWKARITRVVTVIVAAVTAPIVSLVLIGLFTIPAPNKLCPSTSDYCWAIPLYILAPANLVLGFLAGLILPSFNRAQCGFVRTIFGIPFGFVIGGVVGLILAGCFLLLLLYWAS